MSDPHPPAPPALLHAVEEVEVRRVRLPLRRPHHAAHAGAGAGAGGAGRVVVLVGVRDAQGRTGWGESPALTEPGYHPETLDRTWDALVAGATTVGSGPVMMAGHPMAHAAVEAALADLALRQHGRSLREALGGTAQAVLRTAVLAPDDLDDLERRAAEAVAQGAAMLKVKVSPADAVARVALLRRTWPAAVVAADANGTFAGDPEHARDVVAELGRLDLDHLEQPLAPHDLAGHADLTRRTGVALALDESVAGPDDVRRAARAGAASRVNVKPAPLGGLWRAVAVAAAATEEGLRPFVGGMVESGVGRAAALALAARPDLAAPTDLGPSAWYLDLDVTEPVVLDGEGRVVVPRGPGIGVAPDPARLDAWTLERHVVAVAPRPRRGR